MYRTVVTICTALWLLYVPHSGHCIYHQFNIPQFYVLPTQLYLCVLCGSQNKQRLFPYTALTDWFYNRDGECLLRGTDWVLNYIYHSGCIQSAEYQYRPAYSREAVCHRKTTWYPPCTRIHPIFYIQHRPTAKCYMFKYEIKDPYFARYFIMYGLKAVQGLSCQLDIPLFDS